MCGRQQKPHAAPVTDRGEGRAGFGGKVGNEAAAVAEKCKGRREEILQVTHVKRVFNGAAYTVRRPTRRGAKHTGFRN